MNNIRLLKLVRRPNVFSNPILCCLYRLNSTITPKESAKGKYKFVPYVPKKSPSKNNTKKDEKKWKTMIMNTLQSELKKGTNAYSLMTDLYAAQTQAVRFAVIDDWSSLISYLHTRVRHPSHNIAKDYQFNELFAVSLLVIKRNFEKILVNQNENCSDASSLCFSLGNLFPKLYLDHDMRAVSFLLFDSLDKWAERRNIDGDSEEITAVLESMKRKLGKDIQKFSMSECKMYFSPPDREIINDRFFEMSEGFHMKSGNNDNGYINDLSIVDSMREPTSVTDYRGNPFHTNELTENMLHTNFALNMKYEFSNWLPVKNFDPTIKKHPLGPAEDLFIKWEWKNKINTSLKSLEKERIQYPLRNYLAVLPHEQIVSEVLLSVIAACSQGQNLIPLSQFQYSLSRPVMRLIHRKFMASLGIDEQEIWEAVFQDYSRYFLDEEVSRLHTHRVWWEKCCRRHGIPPDYIPPISSFQTEIRTQFSTFIFEVVLKACVFPSYSKTGKVNWIPAFNIQNVALEEDSKVSYVGKANLTQMVKINKDLLKIFEERKFDSILFPTDELPMLTPPRPWYDNAVGGPQYSRTSPIIRPIFEFKKVNIMNEVKARLERAQARPVFDALNILGSTPWRINKDMLAVLTEVFNMSNSVDKKELLETLSIPLHSTTVVIPKLEDYVDPNAEVENINMKEKFRNFYIDKALAEKTKNEYSSLWYWMKYRVVLADYFKDKILFFPHNMDFRGRVYPISPYLNHMGDDINRCILKFAKGRPLGENGLSWLKLHCINLTGKLKRKSISERLVVADEIIDDILDSANNPLDGKGWWLESEEPWQTLAACFEIRDALLCDNPENFISHLAVHQDGSCNGLQHYAALGRDKQGGGEVNLLPSELPADVYSSVAVRVEQKRLEDENGGGEYAEIAQKLREFLPQAVPRKVIKQTVMTTVYGVTMYGAVLQIKRQLKALGIDNDDTAKFASYLAIRTFASLNDAFTSSMQLKNWFRECAKGTSELLRTVEWITPLGLPVVQPYLKAKESKGRIFLAPIPTKQIDAFPPNFVHSLDSTHMMLTALDCSRRGLTFAAVHDCFWTHASTVSEMNVICRSQFVSLHKQPLVKQFSDWILTRYLTSDVVKLMEKKDLENFQKLFSPQIEQGTSGKTVCCLANFVPIHSNGDISELIYQYHISFNPEVDSRKYRMDILRQEVFREHIKDDFIFDGMILYMPRKNNREVIIEATHPETGCNLAVKIKPNVVFARDSPQAVTSYNIIMRRCLELVGFKQLCRHYYNPAQATKVVNYDLEVWSGYETAIRQYENNMMLCIENRFKVLRTKTFLEILEEERLTCDNREQYEMKIEEKYCGQTVVTYYNNRMRKISSIDWDLTPLTEFRQNEGTKITLKDYYEQQYGRRISNLNQPIIICEGKPAQPNQEPQKTYLIPELCQPTGITDEMLKDRRIMRALAVHMRLDPTARVKNALHLIKLIKNDSRCMNLLTSWKMELSDSLVEIPARILPAEKIITATNAGYTDLNVEWSRRMKREGCLRAVDLDRWVVVCPESNEKVVLAQKFIENIKRLSKEMGIEVRKPWCVPVAGVSTNHYLSAIDRVVSTCEQDDTEIQIIVVLLASEAKTTYDAVKKYLSVENAVPSQIVLLNTLSGKSNSPGDNKNFSSIVLKIFQQMICKVGGALWKVNIPLKNSILLGYDLYHDSSLKGKTIGACVSTVDEHFTEFYSQTAPHENFTQLGYNLVNFVRKAVHAYYLKNDKQLPSRLFLYRDGVGDGQVPLVKKEEIDAVVHELQRICMAVDHPEDFIKLAFYIVTKKVNMRFYKLGSESYKFVNPEPGTVVDSEVTRPDRRDFYLVPQFVNQGTVTPVYYNLLHDTTGLSTDKHELLSYKLCHLYYNWQGTVRVPAPCQYAHKLAFFVAQSLHRGAHNHLNNRLYFL